MRKYSILISVFLSCMLFTGHVQGQSYTQNHEIGFRTYNMSSFGFIYKKQKTDNSYSRLRLATGEFDIDKLEEKRQALSEKLYFMTGFELMCTLGTSLVGDKFSLNLTPGIGVVLGVSYMISDRFIMGIETIPAATFKFGYANKDIRISDLNIRFASTYASLFVAYRFSK